MAFERLDNGGNNKFPLTSYGSSSVQELAHYGAAVGSDTQDIKKLEIILQGDKEVSASEYDSSIVSVLRSGIKVVGVTVDAVETFDGIVSVGVASKEDGTGAVATALYTGTPTVGTSEDGIILAPADEVLTEDLMVTVTSAATEGKAKVVITYRDAVSDIV